MLDEVARRFGGVDVLINNAGTLVDRDFTAGTDPTRDLDAEIAVNLSAPIHLTGEVLARWPTPEALVFVTSGFALVSPTRAPTYGAAKAGLHSFTEGLRRQLAPYGTHVLELMPPTTDTPMNAGKTGTKLPASEVAEVALRALKARRPVALPGPSRLLPAMLRLAPGLVGRAVARL